MINCVLQITYYKTYTDRMYSIQSNYLTSKDITDYLKYQLVRKIIVLKVRYKLHCVDSIAQPTNLYLVIWNISSVTSGKWN